jgi:hypothetical protein
MSSLGDFLTYGAIGLGLGLAVLAYLLLRKEQEIVEPRTKIIKAIYVFMGFALLLTAGGFMGEYLKSEATAVDPLRAQLKEKDRRVLEIEEQYRQVTQQLSSSRDSIEMLLDLKDGKIARLRDIDPSSPGYVALIREIQNDLEQIDRNMKKVINK